MECYNEFADIYDELIRGDVDYSTWSEKIIEICDKYNVIKKDYLDLACGTGNLTINVGKKFMNTTAVDLSQDMLTIAQEKLKSARVRAKLLCQDISRLNLKKQYDLITCALDSTNYILKNEDVFNYLNAVHNHLKDSGIFIFDINSEYKLRNILGNNVFNYDDGEVVYIWENEIEDGILNMYLTFFVKEGQVYRRFDEHHKERIYCEVFLEDLIEKIGFQILDKLDNYEDKHVDKKTERIVYVLRKK